MQVAKTAERIGDMMVERKTALAHKNNFGGVRPYSAIKYIVIHFTANDGDTDEANAKYFQTERIPRASAHVFVDDNSITNSVPHNYVAYSVGGKKYSDCAQTGGGKLYGTVTNTNSINIEMCDTIKDGKHNVSDKTLQNTIELCRELMQKYNIDIDHVIRHFDVNGKHCPVYFMDESAWEGFKIRVMGYDFKVNKSYITTQACYLRISPGIGNNKVNYSAISDAVKKKCRSKSGLAVFKKEKRFRLMKVQRNGSDLWGRMKSGYWIPLVYNGNVRAKNK